MIGKHQFVPLALFILASAPVSAVAQQPAAPGAVQGPEIVITHKGRDTSDLMVRRVYIGDLDLKSAEGQQTMEKRVDAAVEEMCAIPAPIPTQERNMTRACRDEAWAGAKPQMAQAVKRATGS